MLVRLGSLPNSGDIGIDTWALGFTLLVSFVAGIIIGIVPALQFTRTSISETLKQGAGRTGGSPIKQHTLTGDFRGGSVTSPPDRSRADDSHFLEAAKRRSRIRQQQCVDDERPFNAHQVF